MSTITFEDGTKVDFQGEPTQADIEEVYQSIQAQNQQSAVPEAPVKQPSLIGQSIDNIGGDRSFLGTIARPFEEVGAGIANTINKYTGIGGKQLNTGLFGDKINPITSGKQLVGNVVEMGSYALPLKAATLVGRTALGALSGYGLDVGSDLANNKSVKESLTPGAGTVVGGLFPFAGALVSKLTKGITGGLTGTGSDIITRAVDNPNEVRKAINTYAKTPELKGELVKKATDALNTFTQVKKAEYSKALSTLTPTGPISKDVAVKSFADNIKKFGGELTSKGDVIFKNSALTRQDQNNIRQVWGTLSKWTDNSPQGLDTLRQALKNNLADFKILGNTRSSVPIGNVITDLTNHLDKSIPGYKKVLSTYGEKSQLVKQVMKELQIGGQAKETTQLNNVLRLLKKDPAVLSNIEKVMGKKAANSFFNEISGAILSDWIPTGKMGNYFRGLGEAGVATAALLTGNPTLAGVGVTGALASSPKIVGKTATYLGNLKKAGVGKVFTKLGGATGASLNDK